MTGAQADPAALVAWAACPICQTTWSEEVPDLGYRTYTLSQAILEDLATLARRCRDHHPTHITIGVEGEFDPQGEPDV